MISAASTDVCIDYSSAFGCGAVSVAEAEKTMAELVEHMCAVSQLVGWGGGGSLRFKPIAYLHIPCCGSGML